MLPTQYEVTFIPKPKDDVESPERQSIGIVEKSEIKRLAKAT